MKKRTVIAIVLTTGLTIVSDVIHADMNTEPDIKVVLPPELFAPSVTNSPDAVTQSKLRRRLLLNISHENEGYSLSTLGQLAKLCDAAVFGHVQEIKDVTAVEKQNSRSRDYSLTVSVVSNLLAGKISSPLTVKYHQWFWKVEVKPGDYVVLFLSPDELRFDWGIYDFYFEKKPSGQDKRLSVMGESRGVLVLEKPCESDEVFNAVKQYVELLRKSRRNADAYYEFLKKTVQSQNDRLIRDGNSDLLHFLRTCDTFDLNRVLDDEEIDNNVKEYVRLVMIPDRENRKAEQKTTK